MPKYCVCVHCKKSIKFYGCANCLAFEIFFIRNRMKDGEMLVAHWFDKREQQLVPVIKKRDTSKPNRYKSRNENEYEND